MVFKVGLILLGLLAYCQAGVQLQGIGVAVAAVQGPVLRAKTTVLANSAPGTGGHAPNNLVTIVRTADGGYVPGEEPDPPVIQRPSSTVIRSDDTGNYGLGVDHHGELVHGAQQPYQFGYINRNEHGGDYHHEEKADGNNRRTGSYGFRGADGTYRRVEYVADEHGYRAKILTNEQGTSSHAAANALTVAEKPPYLQYSPQPAPAPVAQVKTLAAPAYAIAAPLTQVHHIAAAPLTQVQQVATAPLYTAAVPVRQQLVQQVRSYAAPAIFAAPLTHNQAKSVSAPSYARSTPVLHASNNYPAPGLSATAIAASRGTLLRSPSPLDYAPVLAQSGGYAATPIIRPTGYASTPAILRQSSKIFRDGGHLRAAEIGHFGLY